MSPRSNTPYPPDRPLPLRLPGGSIMEDTEPDAMELVQPTVLEDPAPKAVEAVQPTVLENPLPNAMDVVQQTVLEDLARDALEIFQQSVMEDINLSAEDVGNDDVTDYLTPDDGEGDSEPGRQLNTMEDIALDHEPTAMEDVETGNNADLEPRTMEDLQPSGAEDFVVRRGRAQTPGPGSTSSRSNSVEKSQQQEESACTKQHQEQQHTIIDEEQDGADDESSWKGCDTEDDDDTQGSLAAKEPTEHMKQVPFVKNTQSDSQSDTKVDGTPTPQSAPQPTLVEEDSSPNKITKSRIVKRDMVQGKETVKADTDNKATQPSIADKDPAQDSKATKVDKDDKKQQDSLQPSIAEDVPEANVKAAPDVMPWLQSTQHPPLPSESEQAIDSVEAPKDDELIVSEQDKAILRLHVANNAPETPEPEDGDDGEDAPDEEELHPQIERTLTPSPPPPARPPVNRIIYSVRTGRRRPGSKTGKRKRGASSAGRRSKSRSMSRDPHDEDSEGDDPDEEEPSEPVLAMELPNRNEFEVARMQRLAPEHYKWGPKKTPPPLDENLKNYGVRMVNPMDDSDEGDTVYRSTLGTKTTLPRRFRERSVTSPPSPVIQRRPPPRPPIRRVQRPATPMEVDEVPDMEEEEEQQREQEPRKETRGPAPEPPATIHSLPPEIFRKICRGLLISDVQIYVYEGWSKVYRPARHRKNFNIETSVLLVCKQAYWQGIRVLYGENTFVYSLRDAPGPTAKPPADVEKLAQDDSSTHVDDDDDDASEYQDDDVDMYADEEEMDSRRRRRRVVKDWEGDIRISKYFSLFRWIIIEAEHNRYGAKTMQSMADAIDFWKDAPISGSESQPLVPIEMPEDFQPPEGVGQPVTKKKTRPKKKKKKETEDTPVKPARSNIHTLALRIFPSHKYPELGGDIFFTFVSFFAATSPVVASLQTIIPQYIRLEINWKYLNTNRLPTCLSVDMRPLYIRRHIAGSNHDVWHYDKLMLEARDEGANRAMGALGRMAERLEWHCERNVPEMRMAEGMVFEEAEMMGDEDMDWWEDMDAVEGEFVE